MIILTIIGLFLIFVAVVIAGIAVGSLWLALEIIIPVAVLGFITVKIIKGIIKLFKKE